MRLEPEPVQVRAGVSDTDVRIAPSPGSGPDSEQTLPNERTKLSPDATEKSVRVQDRPVCSLTDSVSQHEVDSENSSQFEGSPALDTEVKHLPRVTHISASACTVNLRQGDSIKQCVSHLTAETAAAGAQISISWSVEYVP
ncbi:hypothetical protein E5288_WYG017185 [Bos mutus]|uniref:Uncharacterized protein n=1 Tax=Bos mutus TaxID=72004 RepID=A0A6B0RDP3_9CETA|nr:hypothetical protein [Bos mutus]